MPDRNLAIISVPVLLLLLFLLFSFMLVKFMDNYERY